MKKNFMFVRPLAAALLFAVVGTTVAKEYETEVDEYYTEESDNCCGDTPLNCRRVNLKIRGGINPTIFTDSNPVLAWGLNPAGNALAVVNATDDLKFKDFFKTPGWIVAGEIGFAATERNECFLEFNYAQNKGRTDQTITGFRAANDSVRDLIYSVESYKNFGAFLGHRMYWGRFACNRFDFFVGSKIGLNYRNRIHFDSIKVGNNEQKPDDNLKDVNLAFLKDTVVAGGLQLGFDVCLWSNLKLMVVGEVVASGALRNNQNLAITTAGILPNTTSRLSLPQTGTLVTFPVSAGFVWQF
jgi:hypothetical protein